MQGQYNFKIFYVKYIKNISTHVNHASETYGSTQIFVNRFRLLKMCLILTVWQNILTTSYINEILVKSPNKNVKVYEITKEFLKRYVWFNVINQLHQCDLIRSFAMS